MRAILVALICLLPLSASASWNTYRKKPVEWFKSDEARQIAENLLAWQTESGDWPNDTDTFAPYDESANTKGGTFDDGHTTNETRYLARMYHITGQDRYRDAVLKAVDHIIAAQYLNGGFPQKFPPGTKYPRYITYNDGTMVNLLSLLRDISREKEYAFVGKDRQLVAGKLVQSGLRCILVSQYISQNGLTAWGAQHDEVTLQPRPARTFEPPSLAAAESAGVLMFLMSFDDPSPDVILAVEAGVAWLDRTQLNGVRFQRADGDAKLVEDPAAPPLWARFYSLDTMQPIFAGRDGVVKSSLAEIEQERRAGYAWYGDWGTKVLQRYSEWPYRSSGSPE